MSKISTYEVAPVPKLADKLIGTSVGGEIEDVTYNFTLQELLDLFIPLIPANNLQGVLDFGNTATQDINLFGTITTTNLEVTDTANFLDSYFVGETHIEGGLFDATGSIGTAGQVLTSTGTSVDWFTLPPIFTPNLQQVLTEGNTSSIGIILTAGLEATDVDTNTATINTNITIDGTITDEDASVGAAGTVLSSTVTGVKWVALPVYSATSPLLFNSATGVFSIQQATNFQDGYLSSSDWITFNGKQNAGNYITALTGEVSASGPGSVAATISNAAVIGKVLTGFNPTAGTINAADTILTAFGKTQSQINALVGGVQYQGVWNASTNVPTLVSSVGTQGHYYVVNVAGNTNLNGITDWQIGDWAIFSESTWQKVDNSESVSSVNGFTGAVSLTTDNIPEGTTNLYFLNSRARLALSATSPLGYDNSTGVFSIQQASGSQNGYLSSTDWTTFNNKQNYLSGTGLVKSSAGTISYITDNSTNWNTAYNDSIISAAVTGTGTKTLTLTQQDAGTITASWTDLGLTSVGVSMPSAFNVANSPLTSNGTIAITGAGVASQYIRGDGTLATLPTGGGGGSSVAYYLNGSVNQGTFGGNTYYEMSKVPIIGTGTDFSISTNGYISQFITDAGDPSLLNIPAGNWNFEVYFSASSGGGSPSFYVELYKYDGVVFTLIASSSATPEGITGGTTIDLYLTALAVPSTALTITDRLAIRVYVNNSGRTITLHTENSHLCEVITTFSTGITAINGLIAQVQNLTTGTSGTDFNINSLVDTHTFNLPVASATNTGKLSSTDWATFNSKGNGTVTSVAALTLGTTGTDLSSSVANSTTTPVITLNVPTASATNRGALSSVDWTTFNNKANALSGTINTIAYWDSSSTIASLALATYPSLTELSYVKGVTSAIQTQLNAKQGTLTLTTTGTSGAATLIGNTLNIPQYTGGGGGGMAIGGSITSATAGSVLFAGASGVLAQDNANFFFDDTNNRLGLGTITLGSTLQVNGNVAIGYSASTAAPTNGLAVSGSVVINGTTPLNSSNLTVIQSGSNFAFTCQASTSKTYSAAAATLFILSSNEAIASNPQTLIFAYTGAATLANRFFGFQTGESGIANGGNIVFQQAAGNVGIGATTIGSKLQVNGNAAIGYSASTAAPTNGLAVAGTVSLGTTNTNYPLTLASSYGYFGITNQTGATGDRFLRMGFGIGLTYAAIQGTRFNIADDVNIAMQAAGGNLLVGTTTDNGSKLQISGAATFSSSVTANSFVKSGGTSAQILAADGSVITAGTNITISGGTISSTGGGGGSISLAAIGSTPNANAATLTGTVLNLEPASASFGGVVTTAAQTFNGTKTFTNGLALQTGTSYITYNYNAAQAASRTWRLSGDQIVFGDFAIQQSTTQTGSTFDTKLYLDATANVGIGTITIGSKLQVNGNAAIGYSASTAAPTNGLAVSGNLGVGIAAPTEKTEVSGTGDIKIKVSTTSTGSGANASLQLNATTEGGWILQTGNAGVGALRFVDTIAGVDRMRIFSNGNVGINTTTGGSKLQVNGNAAIGYSASTAAPTNGLAVSGNISANSNIIFPGSTYSWGAFNIRYVQFQNYASVLNGDDGTKSYTSFGLNYYEASALSFRYMVGDLASRYQQRAGVHSWYVAGSGSAGATISFTQAMTLDASANLGIGTTTIGSRLQVNGNAAIGYSASTAAPTNGLAVNGAGTFVGIVTGSQFSISGTNSYSLQNGTGPDAAANSFLVRSGGNTIFSINNNAEVSVVGASAFFAVQDRSGGYANRMGFYANQNTGNFYSVSLSQNIFSVGTTNGRITLGRTAYAYDGNAATSYVTIVGQSNLSILANSGYSLTGANAQSLLDLSGTWNTTGDPTAIKLNITNTASGATSNLMDLQVASVSKFLVDKNGNVGIGTATPTNLLHLVAAAPILAIESNTTGNVFLRMQQSGTVVSSMFYNNATSTLTISNNNSGIQFNTSGLSNAMNITSAGIVNTASRLNVNGAGDNSLFSLNTNGTLYTIGFSPTATANASTTLTITTAQTTWIYNGTGAATWTLPNPSGTNQMFWIKNAGTGTITLNAFSGTNIINNSAASVTSITIAVGATVLIQQDGNVKSYQLQ